MTTYGNIRLLREKQNWTQEQMAEKLNMSKNGYAKLERGESRLTVEHLQKIAKAFNIDIVELLKENRDFSLIIGNSHGNYANHCYINMENQEIEKLQLIIQHKDEIIAQKDKEIHLLEKLIRKMELNR